MSKLPGNTLSFTVVDALMRYWFNTEPDDLLQAVYIDPAPRYVEEKMKIWKLGLPVFWGQLDNPHRWKLVSAAWDEYGEFVSAIHGLPLQAEVAATDSIDWPAEIVDNRRQLRRAVADYVQSEGCDCCRGDDHDAHREVIAKLLGVQEYSDGSGYDFRPYRTAAERNDDG